MSWKIGTNVWREVMITLMMPDSCVRICTENDYLTLTFHQILVLGDFLRSALFLNLGEQSCQNGARSLMDVGLREPERKSQLGRLQTEIQTYSIELPLLMNKILSIVIAA